MLKQVSERPTEGQFIRMWVFDGKPWCDVMRWHDGVLQTNDAPFGWHDNHASLPDDITVTYMVEES